MDDIIQCGNNLSFIAWYLIHHGKNIGDGAFLNGLTEVTNGLAQVVASRQLANRQLGQELHAEGARMLTAGAGKLVAAKQLAVA
jgi:hypothetical protein